MVDFDWYRAFENQTNLSGFAMLDCFIQKKIFLLCLKWYRLAEKFDPVFGWSKSIRTRNDLVFGFQTVFRCPKTGSGVDFIIVGRTVKSIERKLIWDYVCFMCIARIC
jgi:hypothetical protein